jgi:ribosome-associated translation inhibitor RaiA
MNKKFVINSEPIHRVKEYICSVLPEAQHINIKIDRLPTKEFRAKVIVNLPERQLIASKIADTYMYSLEKAQKAVLKQREKSKISWKKRHRTLINNLNIAA